MVCQQTSPAAIAEAAIEDAKFVCTRQYGDAPDVTLHGRLDLTFSCESFCASESRCCRRPCTAATHGSLCCVVMFRLVYEHSLSGNDFFSDFFFDCYIFSRIVFSVHTEMLCGFA